MSRKYFEFYIILQFREKKTYLLEKRLQKALDRADFLKLAWKFSFQGNVSRSSYINISLHHFYKYGLLECHKILFKYSKLFWSLWSFSLPFKESWLSFPFRRALSINCQTVFLWRGFIPEMPAVTPMCVIHFYQHLNVYVTFQQAPVIHHPFSYFLFSLQVGDMT